MKRLLTMLTIVLLCAPIYAQKPEAQDAAATAKMQTKIFQAQYRSPIDLYQTVQLMSSRQGSIMFNNEMRTLTVRDYPENVAEIGEAIKRLDVPAAAAAVIDFRIAVLVGSKSPLSGQAVPDDLAPVVKQLQSTLAYANYSLVASMVQRAAVTPGSVEGSGVVDPSAIGFSAEATEVRYGYHLESIQIDSTSQPPSVAIRAFSFSLMYPTRPGIEPVGFKTPVTMHDNEKVVIGTASMKDKALIVVLTAHFGKQ
jgi:type II secretory pathway component GspD/PulD (secretin)